VSTEIQAVVDAQIDLVAGSGGVFDVVCDGELLFSKFADHRFPASDEIAALLREKGIS
jgi:selT/selW/selH-like putative selenoprotein